MPYPAGVALRELSKMSAQDRQNATLWWRKYAPQYLESLISAGVFDTAQQIPVTQEEFEQWLVDYYGAPSTQEERARKKRLRRLWAIGAIFFFAGGYYYSRYAQRVSWLQIRLSLDTVLDKAARTIEQDCAALRDNRIGLDEWNARMTDWIKGSQTAAVLAAVGGVDRMSPDMWQKLENAIYFQLEHLRNFSRQIAQGLPLDGSICRRMKMYIQAARATYHNIEAGLMAERGYGLYRSVRTADESCTQCIEEEARGFVPIGDLVPIGSRECLTYCKCYYIYMNTETGMVDERS